VTTIERAPDTLDESRLFADEHGFFRSSRSDAERDDPRDTLDVAPGPPWSDADARREVRRILEVIADGRPTEPYDDPLEFAQRNGLLLLIGPEEEQRLQPVFDRMPPDMAEAWRDALRGGSAVEAFGPVSEQEQLDEARVDADLVAGRQRRRKLTIAGAAALCVLVVGVVAFVLTRSDSGRRQGTLSFDAVADAANGDKRAGPPPQVEKALLTRLDRPVAVRAGAGDVQTRVVMNPPATDLPQAPGAIAATVFRYNGRGQVVLVGPAGWAARACVQVSVMSAGLRAFDTGIYEAAPGACAGKGFGRVATVGCSSDTTLMLDLEIPEGEVNLAEGGRAKVGALRVVLLGNAPGYERISLNGEITVPDGQDIMVPAFGGPAGSQVSFDVSPPAGAPVVGTITHQ
jgi:hypothetical protein